MSDHHFTAPLLPPHNNSTVCERPQRGQGGMEEMKGVWVRQAGMESA